MTVLEWLFVLAIVSGWIAIYLWLKHRTKIQLEEADKQTRRRFEKRKTQVAGITSSIAGAMFIIAMLVSWRSAPVGNEPFVMGFVGFGLALLLYGAYKFYESRG